MGVVSNWKPLRWNRWKRSTVCDGTGVSLLSFELHGHLKGINSCFRFTGSPIQIIKANSEWIEAGISTHNESCGKFAEAGTSSVGVSFQRPRYTDTVLEQILCWKWERGGGRRVLVVYFWSFFIHYPLKFVIKRRSCYVRGPRGKEIIGTHQMILTLNLYYCSDCPFLYY